MKIFIWECISQCTDRYHSSGGVVVIADNEERAREIALREGIISFEGQEKPDYSAEVFDTVERVFIFPDAGYY